MIATYILRDYIKSMKAKDFIKNLFKAGTPQTEIARKIGVTPGAITNYIYGKTEPKIDTIMKIASAYGITFASFFNDDPPEYAHNAGVVCEDQTTYAAKTDDERAILEMLRDDADLARRVRRFTNFEKSAQIEDADQTKVA
jgi:transcriptional regulator with XRE-family HTH domain